MMGVTVASVDHMHIICTSLQTDNHASTSSLSFYAYTSNEMLTLGKQMHFIFQSHQNWSDPMNGLCRLSGSEFRIM